MLPSAAALYILPSMVMISAWLPSPAADWLQTRLGLESKSRVCESVAWLELDTSICVSAISNIVLYSCAKTHILARVVVFLCIFVGSQGTHSKEFTPTSGKHFEKLVFNNSFLIFSTTKLMFLVFKYVLKITFIYKLCF